MRSMAVITGARIALILVGIVLGGFSPAWAGTSDDGRLTTGAYHACLIHDDQSLSCWGRSTSGQISVPPGRYRFVSAGGWHTCAIRIDGTLACWGHNEYGQTNVVGLTDRYQEVSGGGFHSCALSEDTNPLVTCWGRDDSGQASPPFAITSFARISAGSWSTCGIRMMTATLDGEPVYRGPLICWGESNGSTNIPIDASINYSKLSIGHVHGCALMEYQLPQGNNVHCWGGQVPGGFYGEATAPSGYFKQISVDDWHGCGIRNDGSLHCWGYNYYGQAEPPPGNTYVRVSSGREYSCAMRLDDSLVCWGRNVDGNAPRPWILPEQISNGTVDQRYMANFYMFDGSHTSTRAGYRAVARQFQLVDGTLPPGLEISPSVDQSGNGQLNGVPTVPGQYSFTIEGRDRNGFEAVRRYTIIITGTHVPDVVRATGGILPPRLGHKPVVAAPRRHQQKPVSEYAPEAQPHEARRISIGCMPCSRAAAAWGKFIATWKRAVVAPMTLIRGESVRPEPSGNGAPRHSRAAQADKSVNAYGSAQGGSAGSKFYSLESCAGPAARLAPPERPEEQRPNLECGVPDRAKQLRNAQDDPPREANHPTLPAH